MVLSDITRRFRRLGLSEPGAMNSGRSGKPMRASRPSRGVRSPRRISATPKMIGNFKSRRYDLWDFLIKRSRAKAVSTPSATSPMSARMSSRRSPRPSRTPVLRLRLSGPKHVPKVSPTPESPAMVDARPPMASAIRCISYKPRVTSAVTAFVPKSRPSHMPVLLRCAQYQFQHRHGPAASARTFFTAPPTSRPTTSADVKTRNDSEASRSRKSNATLRSSDATTTAVARPSAISRANDLRSVRAPFTIRRERPQFVGCPHRQHAGH
mmetsp:Transcript_22173/g.66573  ORF Transcript_22173/g.66573 Transcript_22173/m.66573 type:complete len:267 (+) Transcript_22173:363-1163(+)